MISEGDLWVPVLVTEGSEGRMGANNDAEGNVSGEREPGRRNLGAKWADG
jgi:hypothetical protein